MDSVFSIIIFVLMAFAFVVAMMLSGNGSSSGLGPISGQDLEIFKRTKDRGFIKILQIILFMTIIFIVVALIVYQVTTDDPIPTPPTPPATTFFEEIIKGLK